MKSVASPFVVGVARSGTTLLRLMLDSHCQLAMPSETHFIPILARSFGWSSDGQTASPERFFATIFTYGPLRYEIPGGRPEIPPVALFVNTIKRFYVWHDFHLDEAVLTSRLGLLEPFDLGEGLRIFYGLYAERFGKTRWGDKTPAYMRSMPLIHELLPEARFIHLIRDGRDVWVSVRNLWFGPKTVEEAARQWMGRIKEARRHAQRLPHYCEIRYEELVLKPEQTLQKICEFIDLPWDPSMLRYPARAAERLADLTDGFPLPDGRKLSKGERLAQQASVMREPDPGRIGRWQSEMRRFDLQTYEKIAGRMLKDLGYETSSD